MCHFYYWKVGKRQSIETLIKEEAWLFAKYLRTEKMRWIPKIKDSLDF